MRRATLPSRRLLKQTGRQCSRGRQRLRMLGGRRVLASQTLDGDYWGVVCAIAVARPPGTRSFTTSFDSPVGSQAMSASLS